MTGGLQAQGEALREGAGGNPTGVAEKELVVSLFFPIRLCSYSLRMFEAGKDVCWPVTWEMVAPALGEPRSFILSHFQKLVELVVRQSCPMFIRKASGQLMSMYSGSMSFKINSSRCYSID